MGGAERAFEERGMREPEARRFGASEGKAELKDWRRLGLRDLTKAETQITVQSRTAEL